MMAIDGAVVEVDAAVLQLDVVERKARRLARLGRLRARRQPGQDVVDVVVAIAHMGQAHDGRFDAQRVDHRRQAEDGLQSGVGVDALDAELIGCAIGTGDGNVAQRQLQRPGLELDRADAHRAAELLAADLFALPLQ